jgi:diguanylate cyclase
MKIQEIIRDRLAELYQGDNEKALLRMGKLLEPKIEPTVETFYAELQGIPEIAPILQNAIVEKNLTGALGTWIRVLFQQHSLDQVETMLARQREIGSIHANLNVNLTYVAHGISILKRELFRSVLETHEACDERVHGMLVLGELFDILQAAISEAYFSNEIMHETHELSLKIKGMSQNAAVECERLRSMLLDWFRRTLTVLYQSGDFNPESVPTLRTSTFGQWVLYKADLLYHGLSLSKDLNHHIENIDYYLSMAATYRSQDDQPGFSRAVTDLNEAISQASWYIASVVDQVMELDTGTDPMTRLFNRRYLDTILRRQTQISMRRGLPYSLLLIDLDHFKNINDEHGHESGDLVLRQFSELLLKSVRSSDFVFRYGGEEFLVVLGNVEEQQAMTIAEKVLQICGDNLFELSNGVKVRVTCSIGIAVFNGHPDYHSLVKQADLALYEAKQAGRNRVVLNR